jgi:hypothetical protein
MIDRASPSEIVSDIWNMDEAACSAGSILLQMRSIEFNGMMQWVDAMG